MSTISRQRQECISRALSILPPSALSRSAPQFISFPKRSITCSSETGFVSLANGLPYTLGLAICERKQRLQGQIGDPGLGIKDCLRGKNVLVTGATGFIGTVLIEKILRTQPEVGKIILLIDPKGTPGGESHRLSDMLSKSIFDTLRDIHGDNYQSFISSKLQPLAGNLETPGFGLDGDAMQSLMEGLDVIINSAATTSYAQRFDVSLNVNTLAAAHLLELSKRCKRMKLFVQVSTAYVYGNRSGTAMETALEPEQSIAGPPVNVQHEIKLVEQELITSSTSREQTKRLQQLGTQRALVHGWNNTYVFTKAMAEMMISQNRGSVPVVIIRPTIVESTLQEPVPGWIQGHRMLDPALLAYGKGQAPYLPVNPKTLLDFVPADMLVNCMMATIAKHFGQGSSLSVYQVGHPIELGPIFDSAYEHFRREPLLDDNGYPIVFPKVKLVGQKLLLNLHSYIHFGIPCLLAKMKISPWKEHEVRLRQNARIVKKIVDTYTDYGLYKGKIDTANMKRLYNELSSKEQEEFNFALWEVDWNKYWKDVHLPGLKRHVLRKKRRIIQLKQPVTSTWVSNTTKNHCAQA